MAPKSSESWPTRHCRTTALSLHQAPRQRLWHFPHRRITICPTVPSLLDRATGPSSRLFCLLRFTFHSGAKRKWEHKRGQSQEPPSIHTYNIDRIFSSSGARVPIQRCVCGGSSPIDLALRGDPNVCCSAHLSSFSSAAIMTRTRPGRSHPG